MYQNFAPTVQLLEQAVHRGGFKGTKVKHAELERLFQAQQREAHLKLAHTQLQLAQAQQAQYEARLRHLSESPDAKASLLPAIAPRHQNYK